jgi:hypothetical protein
MPLTRAKRYEHFLEDVIKTNREEAREPSPQRYAVLDFRSGRLNWMSTHATITDCELAIAFGPGKHAALIDLDTGSAQAAAPAARLLRAA